MESKTFYASEAQLEKHIYDLVRRAIAQIDAKFNLFESKKVADIVICREDPNPAVFFIEAKYPKGRERIGFGSGQGAGFQPEILSKKPMYFEKHYRWVLSNDTTDKIFVLSNDGISQYIAGGTVGEKFNNFQHRLFRTEEGMHENEFILSMISWLTPD